MTATVNDTDLALHCDSCGQTISGLGATLHNWDLVWSLFSRHGWTGTRLATGPHSCSRCSRVPLAAMPGASDDEPEPPGAPAPDEEIELDPRVRCLIMRGVPVVELTGDLDLDVAGALREALATAGRRPPHLIVDLSQAKTVDSIALAELVAARHRAARAGGHTCVVGLTSPVRRVLHTLCLSHLFVELPDRETALGWLRGGPVPDQRRSPRATYSA